MGSVKVTVFGRVKPIPKDIRSQEYQLKYGDHQDQITFANKVSSGKKTYRFRKLFSEKASQEEVFDTVARPIIKSVLSGYNGTIFTYGQTGSGKTYTMTGDIEQWLNPGLIPRTVQEIFKHKTRGTLIYITYCEIYNEHVYDLIRVDRIGPELPQVNLLEDTSGISHFRNLSVHLVGSVFEALQLLVRGDGNKMVAETNSNSRSSRSHVIFSIGLEFPHPTEDKLCLRPVLYLVDLAGSEKLSKCKTPMSNPMETRYINLSLHYLEQVLIALRQPGRNHIPYRNSLMTALLRNSLGGNCITAMIATFSLAWDDLEETMQTCRFAERIALIKNEVKLNELLDPNKEMLLLKRENEKLKAQLRLVNVPQAPEELTEKDRGKCAEMVRNFIKGNDIFDLPLSDLRMMEYCFRIMRDEILKKTAKDSTPSRSPQKTEDILDILKKNSSEYEHSHVNSNTSEFENSHIKAKTSEESRRSKSIESNLGRKRTPMDLPKINLTYKRCKSMEKISDNEDPPVKSSSTKEPEKKEFKASNETFTSNKVSSDFSPKKPSSKASLGDKQTERRPSRQRNTDSCLIDGCLTSVTASEILSDNISNPGLAFPSAVKSMSLLTGDDSGLYMQNSISGQTLRDSFQEEIRVKEKITCEEIREFISIGIQVEDNLSTGTYSACGLSVNIESSYGRLTDTESFAGRALPLTGDNEVDEEIVKFYKARHRSLSRTQ